jgi:acyl-CoA synthetase (AMP-forming)/AMP-acid ligase II
MMAANTVDRWIEQAAERFPRLAFHHAPTGERQSGADLATRARRVAARLAEGGVRPGDLVGVLLPNSFELFAVYFGVLRAGAVLVPLAVPAGVRNLEGALHRLRQIALAAAVWLEGLLRGRGHACSDGRDAAAALYVI